MAAGSGLRKSVIKFMQYGGCIIVAIVILNIVYLSNEAFGKQFVWYFGDTLLYLMIYTEVVSVLENIEAIAPQSKIVLLFVRPVRRIITFQLRQLFANRHQDQWNAGQCLLRYLFSAGFSSGLCMLTALYLQCRRAAGSKSCGGLSTYKTGQK